MSLECPLPSRDDPQTYLSFDGHGIYVQCERSDCMTLDKNERPRWYFQGETLPSKVTAEMAAQFINEHLETHA